MRYILDLHIHSKYSRACSPQLTLENIDRHCQIKGVQIVGTGDFTHPFWFSEMKKNLVPAESGLYKFKDSETGTRFLCSTEISCIYSKGGKVRRLHIVILAPSLEVVNKINNALEKVGKLGSDGRPILGLDAKRLAEIVWEIDEECLVIPAHCLLPETHIHTNKEIKLIKDIKIRDKVYTHTNNWKKVEKVYSRNYQGDIYNIRPYYFRLGLKTTPEHPFYVIKTFKKCHWTKGLCKNSCSALYLCKKRYFKNYKAGWVQAKNIQKDDVLVFPRFTKIRDKASIKISDYVNKKKKLEGFSRSKKIDNIIKIDQNFCRLAGYYLAEGYTNSRDCIAFCFSKDESIYIDDLKQLMKKIFNLEPSKIDPRGESGAFEIIYYSKVLMYFFQNFFYSSSLDKKANFKSLPSLMLEILPEKQVEIIKGWWRGDKGYTSSRLLMNQMKIIFLRLGIIPSIREDTSKRHLERGRHNYQGRVILANHGNFSLRRLSFFEDKFDLLKEKEFKEFKTIMWRRHGWIDKNYIYIPIRDIAIEKYKGKVYNLEVKDDNSYVAEFATIHNCWTPWFAVFGSNSGFNSLEECFEELTPKIFSVETGLSSDPPMNWRLSALDRITLVSNSDAHSLPNIGREANVLEIEEAKLSYKEIARIIKEKDKQHFLMTIEFYPQEGMYHWDGHRSCGVSFPPRETKKRGGVCPKCRRSLTIGVLNRVEALADRPEGVRPAGAIDFVSLIELDKIIAEALGIKSRTASAVQQEYNNLIKQGGSELNVLLNLSLEELKKITLPEIGEGIKRMRARQLIIKPGFDGQYGEVHLFKEEEGGNRQGSLF